MVSYLISVLNAKYGSQPVEQFLREFPEPWLVWEPGPWAPVARLSGPRATSVLPQVGARKPATPGAEALATPLRLPRGARAVTVGREGAHIEINDATLSRLHLELSPEGGLWRVQDLGSSNGTWLNSLRLGANAPSPLGDGAQLQAGNVYLTYYEPRGMFRRITLAR